MESLQDITRERDALVAYIDRLRHAYKRANTWEDVHDVFNMSPDVVLKERESLLKETQNRMDVAYKNLGVVNDLLAEADKRNAELEAHVGRLRAAITPTTLDLVRCGVGGNYGGQCFDDALAEHLEPLRSAVEGTHTTSLANLKAQWQAEILEELIQNTSQFREANPVRGLAGSMADELRRQAEEK